MPSPCSPGRPRPVLSDVEGPGAPPSADDAAGVAEFWLWLDALSRALPARQRDVIFLRYQHDLSDEDIVEGALIGMVSGSPVTGSRTWVPPSPVVP